MRVHGILTVKELHKTKKSFKSPIICTEMTYIKKTMIFIQMLTAMDILQVEPVLLFQQQPTTPESMAM